MTARLRRRLNASVSPSPIAVYDCARSGEIAPAARKSSMTSCSRLRIAAAMTAAPIICSDQSREGELALAPPWWHLPVLLFDVRIFAKKSGGPSDDLHYGGVRRQCQRVGDVLRLHVILVAEFDLHQLAGAQRVVER